MIRHTKILKIFITTAILFVPNSITGCSEDVLVNAPPCQAGRIRACYGQEGTNQAHAGLGSCTYGTQSCLGFEGWTVCTGWVAPTQEVCDGIDNDCDNSTDETYPEKFSICGTNEGACRIGFSLCRDGKIECEGSVEPLRLPSCIGTNEECGMELCNRLDDDCDGKTDEGITVELCYTGPPDTIRYTGPEGIITKGECRPGVTWCDVIGMTECVGQVLPDYTGSECMANKDLDCNGSINYLDAKPVDIALVVDMSCSMMFRNRGIEDAKSRFLQRVASYSDVWISGVRLDSNIDGEHELAWPLQSAADAEAAGVMLGPIRGSGIEGTLEAMVGVTRPEAPFFPGWRDNVKHVAVTFTDENCTSYWCQPTGCIAGDWCDNIVPIGDQLLPSKLQALTGNDVEHIMLLPEPLYFPESAGGGPMPLTNFYTPTGARIEAMPNNSAEISDVLLDLLLEITCAQNGP